MYQQLKTYRFECDDCKKIAYFKEKLMARKTGWAIARNYYKCYCENCAPMHRNTGRKGIRNIQINIDELK